MNRLSLIAIPGWIEPWLEATNQPLNTLLDIPLLSSILSKRDISFYVYCQLLATRAAHPALINTFNSNPAQAKLLTDYHAKYPDENGLETFSLQNPNDHIRPIYDGVIDNNETGGNYKDYTFDLVEISSDVLGFKLTPRREDETVDKQEADSLSNLIEKLCIYKKFHEVGDTPAMARWLRLHANLV